MRYKVTDAGHMKDIGGKRRRSGDIVDLTPAQAEFEVLRETVVEMKAEKPAPEARASKAKSGDK